jgi:hypothetical protein
MILPGNLRFLFLKDSGRCAPLENAGVLRCAQNDKQEQEQKQRQQQQQRQIQGFFALLRMTTSKQRKSQSQISMG